MSPHVFVLPHVEREPTRTFLRREPTLIEISKIVMTDVVDDRQCRRMMFSPICVVPFAEKFYVVDGNHRLRGQLLRRGSQQLKIAAWVLSEEDRSEVHGKSLPKSVTSWIYGTISFEFLCQLTMESAVVRNSRFVGSTSSSVERTSSSVERTSSSVESASGSVESASGSVRKKRSSLVGRERIAGHLVSALEELGYTVTFVPEGEQAEEDDA